MARTVCWYRRAAFLVALVLGLAGHGALAQPYTQEGETAVARATQGIADANGDIVKFRDMTIRWRFDVLMGSPLRQFAGRYTHYDPPWVELAGVQTCFAGRRIGAFRPLKLEPQMLTEGVLDQDLVYAHTRFNMILQPHARLSFMISGMDRVIQHEFMVDTFSTTNEYGLSIPGSPNWDRMFQYGHEGAPNNPWLTEAQAKELFEVGFTVSRIEMIEPRYALIPARASYERHFGEQPCGDEPARTVAEADEPQDESGADEAPARPSEPETPADRIAAMLTRVADAQQQARDEQARLEEEAREQSRLSAERSIQTTSNGGGGETVARMNSEYTYDVYSGVRAEQYMEVFCRSDICNIFVIDKDPEFHPVMVNVGDYDITGVHGSIINTTNNIVPSTSFRIDIYYRGFNGPNQSYSCYMSYNYEYNFIELDKACPIKFYIQFVDFDHYIPYDIVTARERGTAVVRLYADYIIDRFKIDICSTNYYISC